jgi:hypothetical protein
MKNIDSAFKSNRVNCTIRVATVVLDDFEDPRPFPSPRFGARVLAAKLRDAQSRANPILDNLREGQ